MPNQNNNDKKLQYLKRDEVRTMEKDVSRLREAEAEAERGRVAKLRTEEELSDERRRAEQAETEAKQRELTEQEARTREYDLKKLRETREIREAQLLRREVKEKEYREAGFKEQLKETQSAEEEQRRRFVERVEAQAEGREPTPPIETEPLPAEVPPKEAEKSLPAEVPLSGTKEEGLPLLEPTLPTEAPAESGAPLAPKTPFRFPKVPLPSIKIPKVAVPKISGCFPGGPFEKLWIRILVSLLILAILTAVATFWYWYFMVRKEAAVAPQPTPPAAVVAPVVKIETLPITKMILDQGYHVPEKPRVIDTIIIHSVFNAIEGDPYSAGGIIKEYQIDRVAAHYLIDREGRIYQTAPLEAAAFHAGKSQMPDGRVNVNDFSIGIELIYRESESPSETQYQVLAKLIKYLRQDYQIPDENILGHKDISPATKTDPWNFDWQKVENLWKN